MFPYSVALGTNTTAAGTVNLSVGPSEWPIRDKWTCVAKDDLDNLRIRHDDLARRVFDLETETAIVGALEDTVRLLVAEVAELRAAKR